MKTHPRVDKPPFDVPSVREIRQNVGANGLKVVSLFSGCGGGSLGLEWAGYEVLWANEFISEAAHVYRLNHPGVTVDQTDIRRLDPDKVLRETGLEQGEVDLMEGSPPCSAFSFVGKRTRGWNVVGDYSGKVKQRSDDLFFDFVRLVDGVRPKVFVAENVAGLTRGAAKGMFLRILDAFGEAGYSVRVKVINAQWLGVPQRRERTIFIGVRSDLEERYDLDANDGFPVPLPYRYTVRDALDNFADFPIEPEAWITRYAIGPAWERLKPGEISKHYFSLVRDHPDKPAHTITQTAGVTSAASVTHPFECRKYSIAEVKRLGSFPDDFVLVGGFRERYERLGRAVPPALYFHLGKQIQLGILDRIKG